MAIELSGKVAIVTGAGGLGREHREHFYRRAITTDIRLAVDADGIRHRRMRIHHQRVSFDPLSFTFKLSVGCGEFSLNSRNWIDFRTFGPGSIK
jgi:hypothetical protein